MENIEAHIKKDKEILQDPTTNPQMRRHIEGELHDLKNTQSIIKRNRSRGSSRSHLLELFCDQNPSEPECLVYDD